MSEWSDVKKWWMDLLKTTIGASLGVTLTVLVVSNFEEKRQKEAFAWQTDQSLRISEIQEFATAANIYRFGAYDAANDQLRGVMPENSDAIRKWRREEFPRLKFAMRNIDKSFPQVDQPLTAVFDEEVNKVHNAVNAAPLFLQNMLPMPCDNKKALEAAWKNAKPLSKPLPKNKTGQEWENFKIQCLDPVLNRYDKATDSLVVVLRGRLAR